MLTEQFLPIKGYEGLYEISNFGRVKSLGRFTNSKNGSLRVVPEKILQPAKSRGYSCITLSKNGIHKFCMIHILVWNHFGDKLRDGEQIDHKDENKQNNYIGNLQLLSQRENISKSSLVRKNNDLPTGVSRTADGTYLCKIQINYIRYYKTYKTIEEASTAYQNKLKEITGSPTVSTLTTSY